MYIQEKTENNHMKEKSKWKVEYSWTGHLMSAIVQSVIKSVENE